MTPPSFWFHPDAPEPLCGEILAPLENSPAYRSTAFTGARSGCVSVDPRKSENNGMNHLYRRFPPVRRFPDFHPIST